MYKDNAVGNVVAETGRDLDFETTARLSDLSMLLTDEVRRSPEPSGRPSAAADSKERQICTTCLFAESVGLCLCFLPSCAMYKDNAVANVVADMGRDLVFMTTARLSDLSVPLKGEVRRSPEQSARQPMARSGKFARRAYSRRALDCEKTTVICFLPSWSTLLFERGLGEEGRFDVAARSETPKTSCQNRKQQLLRPRSGPSLSKAAHTRTTRVKEQQVNYWANIKKGIKLILKTIGNRKGDCAWSCSRWQTQPEKISKLQSTNQYNVRSEWHWFVRCDLQIFWGCVCHLEQLHAQSPFLFPIVFSINYYFDCGDKRTLSPGISPHSHLAGIFECFVLRWTLSTRRKKEIQKF